ncbi:MAG: hypothetical protein GX787_00070 [Tissierellia bacterium]|jgi:hypothetical protein|nr:hypothetical protein [Tissierellia bacterium]
MASNYGRTDSVMTVGEWIGVLIVLGIPIVNIIMYFVWAFSSTTNENLSNFCKATLLIALIVFAFALLIGGCAVIFS